SGKLEGANATLSVYSANGKMVMEKRVMVTKGSVRTTLDVSHLPAGTYLLRLVSEKTTINTKLLKQ
ncbi:MAG TPA: T9SS type A sorting domain-containing protein, partial [Chitinophagaceae bacterium]|nr:T9SS type A sorting domain-containing protein [Chitinophagaceae bacterium]